MRFPRWMVWVVLFGCGDAAHEGGQAGQGGDSSRSDAGQQQTGGSGAHGGHGGDTGSGRQDAGTSTKQLQIPRIYPILRASTPAGLNANAAYQNPGDPSLDITGDDAGLPAPAGANNLGQIVQDRLYSAGPTELLRIVSELDGRTAHIETDPSKHSCLATAPLERTWMFPGGQSFRTHLQCLQEWAGGWLAFGFAPADLDGEDAGAATSGDDFYLVEGQDGGMGGAYRVRANHDVEAWITVADSRYPSNSQVLMHLAINAAAMTTELAFAGSGVGFCSAHLKTGHNYLFIRGKPNAPPPPGAPMGHDCDTEHSGCFSTTELNVNLGAAAGSCTTLAQFVISGVLDASADPEGNVTPSTIYQFFDTKLEGITAY